MAYHHLTPSERKTIYSMLQMPEKYSRTDIANALGRPRCTVSREIKRNSDHKGYNPHLGNVLYWMRRKRIYKRTKREQAPLMELVVEKLKEDFSPEQVAGHLRQVRFPDDPSKWVSHTTIYRHIWEDEAQGGKLFRHLRRKNKKYGKRGKGPHPNTYINGRVSIDERPEAVNKRERLGDWEADTFYGAKRQGCVATVVERKSGYLVAQKMPDARAVSLNAALLEGLKPIRPELLKTLTVDNGKEFSGFKELEQATGLTVYFAHPYSAWERGTNENTNGLLRQYFPRRKDLSDLTEEQLQHAVAKLNNRPRKRLNYRTPKEVIEDFAVALDA